MKVGILGYGEIGKAIATLYRGTDDLVLLKDKDFNEFHGKFDVMHVCIPYSEDFVKVVIMNSVDYDPKLIIIHSTVKVGTTKLIAHAVHAPVRGVHPNLVEGIKTFVMYIGADDEKSGKKAQEILSKIGINTQIVLDSRHTELAKLASTTYYGLVISYHEYVNNLCLGLGLEFDKVMTQWTRTYNSGYKELNKETVVRPILYPPEGKIGGHCIIPNAKLLDEQFGFDPILDSILRHQ